MTPANETPDVLHQWTARQMSPLVPAYVLLIFVGFMAVSHFVFHSSDAVKALAGTAVAALVPLAPGVLNKLEYQLTAHELRRRLYHPRAPREYAEVLRWAELSHVKPIRDGFKYYKPVGNAGAMRRFWRRHLADAYSGEIRAGTKDRARVSAILADLGVTITGSGD